MRRLLIALFTFLTLPVIAQHEAIKLNSGWKAKKAIDVLVDGTVVTGKDFKLYDWMDAVVEPILFNIPVLRPAATKASFIDSTLWKRSSGLYCSAVLTTASNSIETAGFILRKGRSPNEKGGSRRGSRRERAW